jgi:hypothetical protein
MTIKISTEQQLDVTTLNMGITDLRSGDIYRDTTADNVIKVKP